MLPLPASPRIPTMALKATIHKAQLQISDMDRHVYGEHNLTSRSTLRKPTSA